MRYIKTNKPSLLRISANKGRDITNLENGEISLIVKDTHTFLKGDYYIDIERIDAVGFVESSRSILIKFVERYL